MFMDGAVHREAEPIYFPSLKPDSSKKVSPPQQLKESNTIGKGVKYSVTDADSNSTNSREGSGTGYQADADSCSSDCSFPSNVTSWNEKTNRDSIFYQEEAGGRKIQNCGVLKRNCTVNSRVTSQLPRRRRRVKIDTNNAPSGEKLGNISTVKRATIRESFNQVHCISQTNDHCLTHSLEESNCASCKANNHNLAGHCTATPKHNVRQLNGPQVDEEVVLRSEACENEESGGSGTTNQDYSGSSSSIGLDVYVNLLQACRPFFTEMYGPETEKIFESFQSQDALDSGALPQSLVCHVTQMNQEREQSHRVIQQHKLHQDPENNNIDVSSSENDSPWGGSSSSMGEGKVDLKLLQTSGLSENLPIAKGNSISSKGKEAVILTADSSSLLSSRPKSGVSAVTRSGTEISSHCNTSNTSRVVTSGAVAEISSSRSSSSRNQGLSEQTLGAKQFMGISVGDRRNSNTSSLSSSQDNSEENILPDNDTILTELAVRPTKRNRTKCNSDYEIKGSNDNNSAIYRQKEIFGVDIHSKPDIRPIGIPIQNNNNSIGVMQTSPNELKNTPKEPSAASHSNLPARGPLLNLEDVMTVSSVPRLVTKSASPFIVVFANAAYSHISGVDAHYAIGKPLSVLLNLQRLPYSTHRQPIIEGNQCEDRIEDPTTLFEQLFEVTELFGLSHRATLLSCGKPQQGDHEESGSSSRKREAGKKCCFNVLPIVKNANRKRALSSGDLNSCNGGASKIVSNIHICHYLIQIVHSIADENNWQSIDERNDQNFPVGWFNTAG